MNSGRNMSSIIRRIMEDVNAVRPASLLDIEAVRSSVSLILSLVLVLTAVKIPWKSKAPALGWKMTDRMEQINFVPQPEEIIEKENIEGGIVTIFEDVLPEEEDKTEEEDEEENKDVTLTEDEPEPIPELNKLERIDSSPVLEFADQNPSIVGGLSALYLNIDYPLAARSQGIQGLTVLMFVVEKDGSTTDIEVLKSLHPACDSAAVAAVSQTRFKPGMQDGEEVRVKMTLPIRFKLVKRSERYLNRPSTPADTVNAR